ncbi:toprim domain-containing protein [Micromonospora coerulea]|uniref:toprim domain-containing protein n=1 Tax=Micromonospora coerulea TaxID=47856 RepID=UPI001F1FA031|nr:toprim domain-containing protein [Micromonospora veneta]
MDEASETYYQSLKTAENAVEYLRSRALSGANVQYFRLGYVESPLTGHEKYAGKLCIPYVTRSGVVSLRFRAIPERNPDHQPETDPLLDTVYTGHLPELDAEIDEQFPEQSEWLPIAGPKYMSMPGDMHRMFNTRDLDRRESFVCITEGEFDAMAAHQAGLPAVAVPGVNGWSSWWARCFKGYEAVYILCDNDDKGQGAAFGDKIAAQVSNSRVVLMPPGHDVNSFVIAEGPEALAAKIGGKP